MIATKGKSEPRNMNFISSQIAYNTDTDRQLQEIRMQRAVSDQFYRQVSRPARMQRSHDINIARVEAIEMHSSFRKRKASTENRDTIASPWMGLLFRKNCAFL
jgi:hypothetical protein